MIVIYLEEAKLEAEKIINDDPKLKEKIKT